MEKLLPFTEHHEPIELSGKIELIQGHNIQIECRLTDSKNLILDSLTSHDKSSPFRANELWNTTCFEAFWAIPGEPGYWELNLSASQPKWNLYYFENYRKPQPPVENYDFEIMNWESSPTSLVVLLKGQKKIPTLDASLCVILRTNATTHFYSTNHAGADANYHLRKSFTLKLG
jgi:hypothetical protein